MKSRAWVLVEGGKPLEARTTDVPAPAAGEVVVEVDACGLCHTDLGYADGSVAPGTPPGVS